MNRLAGLAGLSLLAFALTGCDGSSSATSDAHTTACRTYRLEVAGQDQELGVLIRDAARSGGWDNQPVNHAIDQVKVAVAAAGRTPGLSQNDFDVYASMADELGRAYTLLNPGDSSSMVVDRSAANKYSAVVDRVRSLCSK